MIEIAMIVAAVILSARIADMENRSSWTWGAIALGICVASLFFPYLPFLRVLIATVVVIVMMMATKHLGKG
jgi:uncharacterized membrane protein